MFHGSSKYIDIKHPDIQDLMKDEEIMVKYCASGDQMVDIFTKILTAYTFIKLKKMIGMIESNLREDVSN